MTSTTPRVPPGPVTIARLTVIGPDPADDPLARHPPAFGRTLRCALAMRGGVSLAVWIGGAVAELDILRRLRIRRDDDGSLLAYLLDPAPGKDHETVERARIYAHLLARAGYDEVEFDILAGASAGGLNSVMYAVSQRAGTGLERLLTVWEDLGGLADLLRPLSRRPVASLLSGDDYLWKELRKELVRIYNCSERHAGLIAGNVTVDLSATVIDSGPSHDTEVAEGRGHFHFEHLEASDRARPGNDIPSRALGASPLELTRHGELASASPAGDALFRLAYAARTTSSFPGAFEPASIHSAPTPGKEPRSTDRPDMTYAFADHRAWAELPYRVIDGGVFDNIPLERALRAAKTRASERHADRCLLYLDPDPSTLLPEVPPNENLSRWSSTLLAAVRRMRRRESVDDEVRHFYDFVGEHHLSQGRLETLAQLPTDWSPEALLERRRAYVRYRGTADADLLEELLTKPTEWQLTSTTALRRSVVARDRESILALHQCMPEHYTRLSTRCLSVPHAVSVLQGPQALFDAASCLLSWIRFLEDLTITRRLPDDAMAGVDIPDLRRRTYHVLATAVQERDKTFHKVLAVTPERLLATVPSRWLSPNSGPAAQPELVNIDLTEHWNELDGFVAVLRDVNDALPPGTSSWHALPGSAVASPFGARDLAPVFAANRIPPAASQLVYAEIRGDQVPAHPEKFTVLQEARADDLLQAALRADRPTPESLGGPGSQVRRLPAQAKLGGTGLLNFRGFLSSAWRTNDWWWGRMDGAAGAARFLHGLPPLVPEEEKETAEDSSTLQDSVLRQSSGTDPDVVRGSMRSGADRLSRLRPGYRISLASHGVRVLGRAVAGTPSVPRPLLEVLLFLLQPLLVLAPAALVPVRAATVFLLVVAGVWLSTADGLRQSVDADRWSAHVLPLVPALAALAVPLVWGVSRAPRKWRDAAAAVPPVATMDDEPCAVYIARKQARAYRRAGVAALAAALTLVPHWVAVQQGHAVVVVLLLAGTAALAVLAALLLVTVPQRSPRDEAVEAALVAIVAALMGPAAVLAIQAFDGSAAVQALLTPTGRAATLALCLFLAGSLVLTGWLRVLPLLVVAVVAAGAGGAAARAVWWLHDRWLQWPWWDVSALALAILLWAAVLWWLPWNGSMTTYENGDELLPTD